MATPRPYHYTRSTPGPIAGGRSVFGGSATGHGLAGGTLAVTQALQGAAAGRGQPGGAVSHGVPLAGAAAVAGASSGALDTGGGGSADLNLDFQLRRSSPGVTNWTDFNQAGDFVSAATNGGHVYAGGMDPAVLARVVKDTTDGLAAGVCLRIDTPADAGANSAAWMFPFATNYSSNASNIGTDIWIQFRFKIPVSRLSLSNCGGNQRGWKLLNLAQYSIEDTDSQSYSNTLAEHVLQDTDQRGMLQAYHRDSGGSFPPFQGFAGGQITLQTAIDRGSGFSGGDRYCHYPSGTPACEFWPTDEWVTIMLRLRTPSFGGTTGNRFECWYARRGASQWLKLFDDADYSVGSPNSNGGGFTHINGAHFLTYETNRVATSTGNVATWHKYAEPIVSRQMIPLPHDTPSSLAQQAVALSSGQWAQVAGATGLGLFTGQQGSSGLAIAYVSKIGRDVHGRKLYFIGCDHGDETLFLVYNETTNAWTEQETSVPWGIESSGTTSHGYDGTTFDNISGKLFHRPYGVREVRRWASGTTWDTLSYASQLFYSEATAGTEFFPTLGANGRVVVYQLENGSNGGLVSIDPVTGSVTTHVNGSSSTLAGTGGPHCFCLYSPHHDCVIFGGGNGSRKVWKMSSSGTITALDDIPSAITATVGPAGDPCALAFIQPSNGHMRVMQSASLARVLNPSASSGSQWSDPGGTSSILSSNTVGSGAYGVAAMPLFEYGVVAFVKNWSAASAPQMWLAKL
ncbi:MAG: cadherin repeat domain-containing protein [Piscinibacter sp.]|uniref:hypothetical protein n=1 Tax=Piscinibacter sp. TaxID=1903157 RepID=UPI00258477CC|nr:hypothetical protein [Piscinibacter sp.]MCW5666520.1 cadherin repeat domain-containing protein [Piscinibacter sp.]